MTITNLAHRAIHSSFYIFEINKIALREVIISYHLMTYAYQKLNKNFYFKKKIKHQIRKFLDNFIPLDKSVYNLSIYCLIASVASKTNRFYFF